VVVVLDWFTVCETAFETLAPKIAVPAYEAVKLCEPAARLDTPSVATPDAFIVPAPRVAAPSLNVTVPAFGVVGPLVFVTVAVSVVPCPKTDGFTELESTVVVPSTIAKLPVPVAVPV
jgi:hypothetical protein